MADAQEGEDVNLRDPQKWYQERSGAGDRTITTGFPLQGRGQLTRPLTVQADFRVGDMAPRFWSASVYGILPLAWQHVVRLGRKPLGYLVSRRSWSFGLLLLS